jgi:hypothetical protein
MTTTTADFETTITAADLCAFPVALRNALGLLPESVFLEMMSLYYKPAERPNRRIELADGVSMFVRNHVVTHILLWDAGFDTDMDTVLSLATATGYKEDRVPVSHGYGDGGSDVWTHIALA